MYMYRPANNNVNSKVVFVNSSFDRNAGNNGNGGVIYFYSDSGNIYYNYGTEIVGCNFTNNGQYNPYTRSQDSVIYWSYAVDGLINGSTFANNNGSSGTVYLYHSDVDIYDSTFTNNNINNGNGGALYIDASSSCDVTNTKFERNGANGAGAIYISSSGNTIKDSTFINNTAKWTGGGAIYAENTVSSTKIYNSTFEYNHMIETTSNGGAILYYGESLDVQNSTFCYNTAINGGAIYSSGSNSNFYNDTFKFNNATADYGQSNTGGGALWITGSDIVIDKSKFINNTASNYGGAFLSNRERMTVKNSEFYNNTAAKAGAFDLYNGDNSKILNNTFTNNSAIYGGGALWVSAQYATIDACNFTRNTADCGGAISFDQGNNMISNCNFVENSANASGGAIYNNQWGSNVILNTTFLRNTARNGGAVYTGTNNAHVIDNSTFIGNRATHNGGAVYILANLNNTGERFYSDYKLFSNYAVLDGQTQRETLSRNGWQSDTYKYIVDSYFEDNVDYLMNVTASVSGLSAVITVNVPVGGKNGVNIKVYYNLNGSEVSDGIISGGSKSGQSQISSNQYHYDVIEGATLSNAIFFKNDVLINGNITNAKLVDVIVERNGGSEKLVSGTVVYADVNTVWDFNKTQSGVITINDVTVNSATGKAPYTLYNLISGFYNVTASYQNDEYLYKENYTSFSITDSKGDFTILQGLIDRAIEGDGILYLTRNYTFTERLDKTHMNITGKLTIFGNGFSIIADGHCRIFNITADDVVLDNITFEDGKNTTDKGGAIYWSGSNGTVSNSLFRNNTANIGGAIYFNSSASNAKIINCTFYNNNATENGGAIDCNASRMNLTNTIFDSNNAKYGAALCREINATGGFGYNNTFIANHAYVSGAALCWFNATGIVIDTYYFYDNTADVRGGAIYVGPGSEKCQVINSTFKGNNVTNTTGGYGGAIDWFVPQGLVLGSTFIDNNAFNGGGIYVGSDSGNLNITNSTFEFNSAEENGGAVNLASSSAMINGSHFHKNHAHGDGGAIYVGGEGLTNSIYDTCFEENKADNGVGGAVAWLASSGNILDSNFTDNSAIYGGGIYIGGNSSQSKISGVIFKGNNATENGGAIDWNATMGNLTNTQFISNNAKYGAALCRESNSTGGFGYNNTFTANHAYIGGAALGWLGADTIKIDTYYFYNNTADVHGGAIYIGPNSNNCKIVNSIFEGNNVTNSTSGFGGAIVCIASNTTIDKSSFKNNNAHDGGAVYVTSLSGNTNITKSNFTDNHAVDYGGAIGLRASTVQINESYFDHNTASYGGAVYTGGVGRDNYIINSTFKSNNATINGGAVDWNASYGNVTGSTFEDNHAYNGGAIYVGVHGDAGAIINSTFKDNTAVMKGGAVDWNASSGDVWNSTFENNNASYGGAIFVGAHSHEDKVINSTFRNNHATVNGGAIDWNATSGDLEDSKFYYNTARNGGAVFVGAETNNGKINNSYFEGNSATLKGGAVDWNASAGNLLNSNFTKNHAIYGGAVFVGAKTNSSYIINSIFTENSAESKGGAVDWNASAGHVIDSQFYNNTASVNGGAIFVGANSENGLIKNSIFEGNNATLKGGAVDWYAKKGNITGSNFTKNHAAYGGAVFVGSQSSDANIFNSTFILNSASENGGAIDWNASAGDVEKSTFENNTAKYGGAIFVGKGAETSTIINSTFNGNNASMRGGAVDWNASSGYITNSSFESNNAQYGGAVFVGHGATSGEIMNSTFTLNKADRYGGAILFNNISNAQLLNSTFNENSAYDGGAVYVSQCADFIVDLAEFTKNSATNSSGALYWNGQSGHLHNSTFTNNTADVDGGAISWEGDNGHIYNVTFTDNSAIHYGGAIEWENSNNGIIKNVTFVNNTAHAGGAILWREGSNNLLDNVSFKDNSAHIYGGAIYGMGSSNATIKNATFDNNEVTGDPALIIVDNGDGGAIAWNVADDLEIYNSTFINNRANSDGAAIFIYEGDNVTLFNLTVENNEANDSGAISLNYMDDLIINQSTINKNIAHESGYGGGLNILHVNGTVYNTTFEDNSALYGNSISVNHGNVNIVISNLSGENQVLNMYGANTSFVKTTINNGADGAYSIMNYGNLSLNKNIFDCRIINMGYILTPTNTTVLDNKTIIVDEGSIVDLNASIVDDNGNVIVVTDSLLFNDLTHNVTFPSAYVGDYNYGSFLDAPKGVSVISVKEGGLLKNTVKTGTIIAKGESDITFVVEKPNECSEVTIKAYIHPDTIQGNISFYIDGVFMGNKSIENGFAVLKLYNQTAGTYTVTATNIGDTDHYGSKNSTFYTINLFKTNLNVSVANVVFGQNATVIATTNANGTLTFIFNGKEEKVEIVNGEAKWNITGLKPGDYSVFVVYEENGYYNFAYNKTTFTIDKLNSTVDINVTTPINVGDDAVINITMGQNINGTVILSIGGNNYTVNILNGKGNYTARGLANSTYDVKAIFAGDDIYNGNESSVKQLSVNKNPIDVTLSVNDTIKVGQDAIVNVELSENINATVTVSVNGENYTVSIVNGKGKLVLSGLANATYTINATYAGDDKYVNAISNTETLEVNKYATNITVDVNTPVIAGDDAVITINLNESINTTVKLTIGENTYDVAVVNGVGTYTAAGLANATYVVNATFAGDDKYSASSSSIKTLEVNKVPTALTINVDSPIIVGSDAVIGVELNQAINATVIVSVNDKNYTVGLVNGKANLTLSGLANGTYTIKAIYAGDNKYVNATSNIETLEVNKVASDLTINVDSPLIVGSDAIVNITLNPNINATVLVLVNGVKYYVAVVNGKGNLTLSNLANGTYVINATYVGDDKYINSTSTTETLEINKVITALTIDVDTPIVIGGNAVIGVELDQAINATVTVSVNNKNYTVGIVNGKGNLTLSNLVNGTYVINATYAGDNKYVNSTSNTITFDVNAIHTQLNISVNSPINVGDDAVITIKLNESINTSVTLKVGDKTYAVAIVNGEGSYNVSGLANGTYLINATYAGDSRYVGSNNQTTLLVNKMDYNIEIDVIGIRVGETQTIKVILPADAKIDDNLIITINETDYGFTVINGVAYIEYTGVNSGKFVVNVTYAGDDKYVAKNNTKSFVVSPSTEYEIGLTVDARKYGADTTFSVTVPNNVEENVTISVDGHEYSREAINGVATLVLNNLTGGLHTVIATYPGDSNYPSKSKSQIFTIRKADSTVDIEFTTPKFVGDDVVVNVTMGQEINGTVVLSVDKNNYTVIITNGNGSYTISGLANATYDIKAIFDGNNDYEGSSSQTKTLEVNKIPTEVTLTVNDTVKVGQDAIVNVEINKNINATVVVSVNNKNYTVSIVNGKGKLTLTGLANGTYTINATFAGDDKYIGDVSNTETLEVNKYATNLTVDVTTPIIVGADAVITINLNESVNATVKLTVGDNTYDVAIVNGAGTFTASNLANGTYAVNATFAGNDKYSASASSVKTLEVNKVPTELTVDVASPIVAGADAVIGVELNQAINATVIVSVNDKNYTVGLVNGKANLTLSGLRSEERRVGKECISRWSPYH